MFLIDKFQVGCWAKALRRSLHGRHSGQHRPLWPQVPAPVLPSQNISVPVELFLPILAVSKEKKVENILELFPGQSSTRGQEEKHDKKLLVGNLLFKNKIFLIWYSIVNIDNTLNTRNGTYHVTSSDTILLTCKKTQSLQITEATSWGHLATQPHPLEGGVLYIGWVPWRGIKRGGWH